MRVPEDIEPLLFDELVVWIVDHCLFERRIASVHDEEDDSAREDVRLPAVVMLQRNLRSHVSLSAQLSVQDASAVVPSNQARKPKICNLQYEVRAQQHILRFDVPMRVSLLMHVVDSIHHLVEVSPCNSLCEFASFRHVIKQLAPACVLKYNGEAAQGRLIRFLIQCLFLNRNQLDQILVIEYLHYIEFLLESFEGGSLMFVLFDGY